MSDSETRATSNDNVLLALFTVNDSSYFLQILTHSHLAFQCALISANQPVATDAQNVD